MHEGVPGTRKFLCGKCDRVTRGEMVIFCDIFINYSKHMALLSCFNDGSEH